MPERRGRRTPVTSLVTVLDVENVSFSRTIRGYNPDEVEDFLDQVADTLQYSAERQAELEQEIRRLQEKMGEYDTMRDSLQEALLMAQRSSEERLGSARKEADAIVAEARSRAEGIVNEARGKKDDLLRQCDEARKTKEMFLADFRSLLVRFSSLVDGSDREEEDSFP
nr:DivIVA domain-containing protein [Dethiosulfovibrio faecalis]